MVILLKAQIVINSAKLSRNRWLETGLRSIFNIDQQFSLMTEKVQHTRADRTIDLLAEVDAYISGDPNDVDVKVLRIMLLIRSGQHDEAIDLGTALVQKPDTRKLGLIFRSYAYTKKDNLDLALFDYVDYVKLELADYFKMGDISDTFIMGSEALLMFKLGNLVICIKGEVHKMLLKMFFASKIQSESNKEVFSSYFLTGQSE